MTHHPAATHFFVFLALAAGLATAGCSMGTLNGIMASDTPDPEPVASTTPRSGAATTVNMAGRWVLATPGVGYCNMNFAAAPGGLAGTIAPEGGCPGKFFTSRQWALERNAVVIRNHAGETLAQLNVADPVRLEGQSAAGEQVSLTR